MLLLIAGTVLSFASSAYILVLFGRMALDWSRILAPNWRPKSIMVVLANVVYSLTDPPINWLRRYIPPLRLGAVALDVGFLVLFVTVSLAGRLGIFIAGLTY